ncbi:MAG TPA: hypothetical protein VFH66_09740 [Mycobacteriales bacterium]|nr:hypothetical protein [Mycobacteriales bacterium]
MDGAGAGDDVVGAGAGDVVVGTGLGRALFDGVGLAEGEWLGVCE